MLVNATIYPCYQHVMMFVNTTETHVGVANVGSTWLSALRQRVAFLACDVLLCFTAVTRAVCCLLLGLLQNRCICAHPSVTPPCPLTTASRHRHPQLVLSQHHLASRRPY
jgi:hypothetical protein